jgi:hypothetical protein
VWGATLLAMIAPLAACDSVLRLDNIRVRDAAADARPDGPLCLAASFDGSAIDAAIWAATYMKPPSMLAETGGKLVITLGNSAQSAYAGVDTNPHDLGDARTEVEVDQVAMAMGATNELNWAPSAGPEVIQLYVEGNKMFFSQTTAAGQDATSSDFDILAMRYWRLRHDAGATTVTFETSSDDQTWTAHRELAPAFALTSVVVTLEAGTYTTVASPGAAKFDNFRMTGTTCQ